MNQRPAMGGYSPPSGSRIGIGGLQLGYYDHHGNLHYAGGVGTGFNDAELGRLRAGLDGLRIQAPEGLLVAGDPIEANTVWVRPELIAELKFTGWAGSGRVRHAVYLGLREDKASKDVVRDVADPEAPRVAFRARGRAAARAGSRKGWHVAVPPKRGFAP
jgi:bifunctional non-homologous end joining protein LigD